MDGGRKRIDIDYTNIASRGFFYWIHAVHGTAAPYVAVECKNYSKDPKNPEFDQLSGRFTVQRGSLGLLVYRTSLNKSIIIQRCKDAAVGGRGYMLPIDDADLGDLVAERVGLIDGQDFRLLHQRFKEIVT